METSHNEVRFTPLSSGKTRTVSAQGIQGYLDVFNETQSFKTTDYSKTRRHPSTLSSSLSPTDQIEEAHRKLNAQRASDLLDLMARMAPYRFEQLVLDLLSAMGYGGSRAEAAQVTKKSNDEGFDGIINEDRLGLDVIYVQAKRWQSTVGREPIQSFVGALAGQHANKGVFIITSDSSQHLPAPASFRAISENIAH